MDGSPNSHVRPHKHGQLVSKDSEESQWEKGTSTTHSYKNLEGAEEKLGGSPDLRSHSKVNTKWTINLHVKDKL